MASGNHKPPPHANAEIHKEIMAKLAKMTPKEVFEASVQAGVHNEDGTLSEHYRDTAEQETERP